MAILQSDLKRSSGKNFNFKCEKNNFILKLAGFITIAMKKMDFYFKY